MKQKRNEEELKKEPTVASPTPAKPRAPVDPEAFNNFHHYKKIKIDKNIGYIAS